ncbi:hypothetical protein K8R42_00285, partial [bacterium]|nr:hypothetical protein [bacterium]
IRTIGNPRHRFEEDHLRLIRAVRFAARFRFTIEPETLQAIREMAAQLTTVSLERLRDELSRIMQDPRPDYGLELLQNSGLLSTILQLFPVPNLALERLTRLRKLALSTIPSALRPPAFFIFLCCPLQNHQADPHRVQRTLRLFRFANSEVTAGGTMVSHLFRIRDFDHLRHADRIRLLRDQHFPGAHILAATLYNLPLTTIEAEIKRLEGQQLFPPPLITGKELKAAGLEPGPQFKEILHEIETHQLEGTLQDSNAALELALQLAVVD